MIKQYVTLLVLVCSATSLLSMETHRQRQEREMFCPRSPAPVYGQPMSVRQHQEAAMAVTAAAIKPAATPAQPNK